MLLNERLKSACQCFVQQSYSAAEFGAISSLEFLIQAALFYEISELFDVFRQKHGVMQQLLMAFITEDRCLAFMLPRARTEDAFSEGAAAVR